MFRFYLNISYFICFYSIQVLTFSGKKPINSKRNQYFYLADISVVSVQQYLLGSISIGDSVFGCVDADIGDSLLSGSLTDAIVVSINKRSVNPKIEHTIPGVYCFDELGTPIVYNDACDENEITKQEAASALRDLLLSHTQFHYMDEIDDGIKNILPPFFQSAVQNFHGL